MNKLGIDLMGKVVAVNIGNGQVKFASAFGGFGCDPESLGNALYVRFADGTTDDVRHQVERLATDAEAEAFEASIFEETETRLCHEWEAAMLKEQDAKKAYMEFTAQYQYNSKTNRMEKIS